MHQNLYFLEFKMIRNGIGIFTYSDDSIYEVCIDGIRMGKGIYTFVSGDKYEGDWKNNKPNGKDFYIF